MNLKSAIESLLFLQGEPMEVSRLIRLTGAKKAEVLAALSELREECRGRGIVLLQNGEEWQLATNSVNKGVVEKFLKSEFSDELSRASLEVLAIVAYKGPISRAGIEYVRGVDSAFTLRNLLIRGLVLREENPADRRSYLYRLSTEFLKHAGLSSPEELPHFGEFRKQEIPAALSHEP